MIGRIVEIADDGRHLSVDRGFLVVCCKDAELGRVPLDDIAALVANAHGITYSNNLLVALAERNAAFVVCGRNHSPSAILWPVDSNYEQSGRIDSQLKAARPVNKRLWQQVIRAKLMQQAAVLEVLSQPKALVESLIAKVKSGDPDNIEAQAARRYWPRVFGDDFRRDRNADGTNAMLNYGYTILRSITARAVFAAGLHPALGLAHSSAGNAMRLVDDLMEPFRPLVDIIVYGLIQNGTVDVNANSKKRLATLAFTDMKTPTGNTPVQACVNRLAVSLVQVYGNERTQLEIPEPATANDLESLMAN